MRISDWSSDVCSSDLIRVAGRPSEWPAVAQASGSSATCCIAFQPSPAATRQDMPCGVVTMIDQVLPLPVVSTSTRPPLCVTPRARSDERRVGKEGVCQCRTWGAPYHYKQKSQQ